MVESLLPLIDQPPSTTRSRAMSSLDSDMKNVLERSDLSDHDKAVSYNQLLGRYNALEAARAAQPVRVSVVSESTPAAEATTTAAPPSDAIEREIVDSVPKTLKAKAGRLIAKMKSDPLCRWNDRGEFVYDGRTVKGSNMVDLVNDLMRTRKKMAPPVGWQTFGERMRGLNVPMEFVGNPRYRKAMQQSKRVEETASTPAKPIRLGKTWTQQHRRTAVKKRRSEAQEWETSS